MSIRPMIVLTDDEIAADAIEDAARAAMRDGAGAVVRFLGTVRDNSQGHAIAHLEYQAYRPMAEQQLQRIAEAAQEQWGCACAIAHRLGTVRIGEVSVVVAVAAPHRREAFAACAHIMERIKQDVPIWKKEVATDGVWWVEDPVAGPSQSLTTVS